MNLGEIEKKIKKILIDKLSPKLIYIFGSIITNRVRNDSDIDIAILTDKNIDEYQLYMMSQQLADDLKREVDIVDLKRASTVFKAEVLRNGKLIYNSDNQEKMIFQLGVLQDYVFLNERRREIINKLKKKGSTV
ncbi:MAG: nucleotidyltransferase domain-containing protein [Candidatus Caldatribacteriota bacterium]|jgi:predicted nucleotidyltransferase